MEKKHTIRTCTVTHANVYNLGATLQMYALQKAILKLGYENDVLDYDESRARKLYDPKLSDCKSIKEIIKYFYKYKYRNRNRIKNYKSFIDKYIVLSKHKYSKESLGNSNDLYDLFISGSDQVWNLQLHEYDTAFMLDFVDAAKKKGSYAASFGYSIVPLQFAEKTKNLLSEFSYLLVREDEGKEWIRNNMNRDALVVADPSVLLLKDDYDLLCDKPKYSKYILVYHLTKTESLIKFARKIAKEKECNLICINNERKDIPDAINLHDVDPKEFICLIKYADCVVTSSFHGIMYSLIMNTQFFYELNPNNQNRNTRIYNLEKIYSISDREISKAVDGDADLIDFSDINSLLSKERQRSLAILENMLESREKEIQELEDNQ